MHHFTKFSAAFIVLLSTALASAQPSMSKAVPSAIAPGGTTEITIHGAKLERPLSVWTSFPAKVEVAAPGAKPDLAKVVCKITPDPTVQVGIGGIIVATPAGVSDTFLMLIDDLPTVQSAGNNTSIAAAQEIKLPTAVDGASVASGSAFYRFAAKAGQRISVEALGRRIASPLDPVIWLRDEEGRELAYSDDDPNLGADSRFGYTFDKDGNYIVEIQDNSFQGGRRYRLRIGDFPIVTSAYPLGGRAGSQTTFNFAAPIPDGIEPTTITLPSQPIGGRTTMIGAKYKGGKSSALVTVASTNLTEPIEVEPNNEFAKATPVELPCAVNGVFESPGDKDHFQFEGKKGQRLVFSSYSRSLGSATYVMMKVLKADGGQVAANKVADAEEQVLRYTIPADGTYHLAVEELLRRGGPELSYRVSIEESLGFSLNLKHDAKADAAGNGYKRNLAPNGAFALDVEAVRDGYNGPITLALESSAGEFKLLNNVIKEKQKATKLLVTPPKDLKEGTFVKVSVIGKAKVGDKDVAVRAGTFAKLRAKWKQIAYPPAWHDGLLAVATVKPKDPFFDVKPDNTVVNFARGLTKSQITLTPERKHKDFKTALTILTDGLPAGVSASVKTVGKVPSEKYEISLTGPKELPAGDHKIRLVSYAEFQGQGKQVVKEIPVKSITPLTLEVAPAGPIAKGKTQIVKVTLKRVAIGARQPVTIRWKKLPEGVTGPGNVTIAAAVDQIELQLQLNAAAEAKAGKFNDVLAEAVTKVLGQDVTVASKPASLEVK